MTRTRSARVAGVTLLLYIATGLADLAVAGRARAGATGTAATLASLAAHAPLVRLTVVLGLLQSVYAVVLGVTLYALTREVDREIALLGLCFRAGEGLISLLSVARTTALLTLATGGLGPDSAGLGDLLLKGGILVSLSATSFALGSTCFAWLLLRGRGIPAGLAGLGVGASLLIVLVQPAELAGWIRGPVVTYAWLPMLCFELGLAGWLLVKGVATPATNRA